MCSLISAFVVRIYGKIRLSHDVAHITNLRIEDSHHLALSAAQSDKPELLVQMDLSTVNTQDRQEKVLALEFEFL